MKANKTTNRNSKLSKGNSGPLTQGLHFTALDILRMELDAGIKVRRTNDKKTKDRLKQLLDFGSLDTFRLLGEAGKEPDNALAAELSAPAVAVIDAISKMMTQAEVVAALAKREDWQVVSKCVLDQLDFALALIYRNLGFLISWRGRRTRNSDLFCEAIGKAEGDGVQAAHLIRRCPEFFPDEIAPEPENIADSFAWETYQRVEELNRLADEFPKQIASAAKQMHGWPMLRQRHDKNHARFEALADKFDLGAAYPLDTSNKAHFRPDTPMVLYLDQLVYRLHHIYKLTRAADYPSLDAENKSLKSYWWEGSDDPPNDDGLAALRAMRKLPPLTKITAPDWAKTSVVPLILATDARDYKKCEEPALKQIARQNGVKSQATFRSRMLAAVIPTLTSMARTG